MKITDLGDFLPLMQMNIECNKHLLHGHASAADLKWGTTDVSKISPQPDFILMSDCIYYMEAVDDLVKTMVDLSSINIVILCCYEERSIGQNVEAQKKFLQLVEGMFSVNEVPLTEQHPEYRSDDIHILHFKKR